MKVFEVGIKEKYIDVTFCSNEKCNIKTCFRHQCHNGNPNWTSIAEFEDTEYCTKKYKEELNNVG